MRPTNWYVFTGAPCSGKTSVIAELERRGFRVVHEVARAYINRELRKGNRLEQIKADALIFERHILTEKLNIEAALSEDEIVFLDRAVPDSIAYFQLEGLDDAEPLKKSRIVRYKKIFLFEPLAFLRDAVRSEDDKLADRLNRLTEESYRRLNYKILRVPILPIDKRADFILQHLE
jgi:predicted ATPase